MPITALQLYEAAQLSPASFGSAIPFDLDTPDEKDAAAVDYIDREVLPLASSEVEVPVRKALGDFTSVLNNEGIKAKFGGMAEKVISLWDACETSYGRSELNKRVDSNSASYDKDSDQDRIQGNQRLQKLLDFVTEWLNAQPGSQEDTEMVMETTQAVETVFVW